MVKDSAGKFDDYSISPKKKTNRIALGLWIK